jgi:hypothetical protein
MIIAKPTVLISINQQSFYFSHQYAYNSVFVDVGKRNSKNKTEAMTLQL